MSQQLDKIREQYQLYCEKIDQLSLKERVIILFALLAAVFLIWYLLLMMPLNSSISKLKSLEISNQKQVSTLNTQAANVIQKNTDNPDLNKMSSLQSSDKKLAAQIDTLKQKILSAAEWSNIFKDLLLKTKGLILINVNNLPDMPLMQVASQDEIGRGVLYKQGMEIHFTGKYFQILDYLKNVENLKWKLFWDELHYEVKQYPEAKISLKVHTLSYEKED